MNNNKITASQILAIIDTYEGMLRLKWDNALAAEWTKWKARLCAL